MKNKNEAAMKTVITLTSIVCSLIVISAPSSFAQDFITPEMLDIENIKQEESLDENVQVKRLYIFLAILNGNSYDTYVSSGKADTDSDGSNVMEEPNDLDEYEKLPYKYETEISISDSEHISYISSMPNFEELFPNEENPLDTTEIIEVSTETTFMDENRLTGSHTIPLYNQTNSTVGVERFIAFYNKSDKEKSDLVTSYGFIAIQLAD